MYHCSIKITQIFAAPDLSVTILGHNDAVGLDEITFDLLVEPFKD
jgi:hypothetical protein